MLPIQRDNISVIHTEALETATQKQRNREEEDIPTLKVVVAEIDACQLRPRAIPN